MIKNLLAGLLLCICIAACEEPDIVSSDVVPGTDQPGVFFTDTMQLLAFTTEDTKLGSNNSGAPMFLGTLSDQYLGTTSASFYIQMLVGTSFPTIPATAVADSIVLSLAYSGIYGDSSATHTVSVYELGESLSKDSSYYTTDTFDITGSQLGSAVAIPSTKDSVPVNGVNQAPQLRFRLNNSFAETILEHAITSSPDFANNSNFLNYFKGLYIKSDAAYTGSGDVKGSIISLNPTSSINSVTLYYKDTDTSSTVKSYSFQLGASSVRSNQVMHSYPAGITSDSLQTPSSLFVQSLNGLRLKVKFPNITSLLADGPVSINKAQLVIKVKSGTTDVIKANSGFFITYDNISGNNVLIPDYNDGQVNGILSDGEYKIEFAQQMQRILNGSVNDYIYITAAERVLNSQRSILEGAGSIKLNITYTKK